MKKKRYLVLMAVLTSLLLSGCCLSHKWQMAGCEAPRICEKCGETAGEALGHDWKTVCEAPQTCVRCGATRGEASDHSWVDATCETAKTCTACGAVEGEALGHQAETGKFVERLIPMMGSDELISSYWHTGTCSVCGKEFAEVTGGREDRLVWGGWSAVNVTVNGESADDGDFLELQEDGTVIMILGGMASYGTWEISGIGRHGEGDELQKEGEERPLNIGVELVMDGGSTLWDGEIDGTGLNSMILRRFSLYSDGPWEVQFRRGITAEDQEILDSLAAGEESGK